MMRIALTFSLLAGLCIAQDQEKDIWMTDFAAAKAKAKAEKKDLLVDFTGSDWCGWCIKLDNEVFSKDEFKAEAPKHFVLVKLDYPQDTSKMSKELLEQNEKLQEQFPVEGFPTLLLMDADANVFDSIGYQEGGPTPYNEALAERIKKGAGFKAALEMAKKKEGVERAKALDDGLTALDEGVAAMNFDLMKEIVKLDADGKAGLKSKYEERVNTIEESRQLQGAAKFLQGMIAEHMEAGEGEKAIAKLEAVIAKPKDKMHHQMALFFKGMVIMDTTQDTKAAIAALEAAAALSPKSPIAQQIAQILPQIKAAGGDEDKGGK